MLDNYKHRSWNLICQRCGSKYKAHQITKEWTGLLVCKGPGTKECFDHRNPQDFVRSRTDKQTVPFASPEPEYTFAEESECSICDRQGIVGIGTAGCMTVGYAAPSTLLALCTDEFEDTP